MGGEKGDTRARGEMKEVRRWEKGQQGARREYGKEE
jgi:hypothetical protein